ncbi:hypothetical protein I4U23_009261 [Adineta vaga]|nr:hypothetical protein I4U23_009261 [Adineta vaga]
MTTFSAACSTSKQVIISLRNQSHEVCVAITDRTYWEQLLQDSNISITVHGKYVPKELNSVCNEDDQPRLHLIIKSQYERDLNHLDEIYSQLHMDLIKFEHHDLPIYDYDSREMIVFGSLYNSLPNETFEIDRNLLGQRNCNIKRLIHTLGCAINIEKLSSYRYRFIIKHEQHSVRNLAVIQIQALVRQAQDQYVIAFATSIGRSLTKSLEPLETMETSSSNLYNLPSFTPFQSLNKRRREDDLEQPMTSDSIITVSDESDDESITNETRNQRREDMERLLDRICQRMQDRTPKDDVAKAREDSSQIKSYFRNVNTSKFGSNDMESVLELVEHEIDLRTRKMTDHKCTLVFNKQLKMGAGVCDRLKRTAKVRAYKQLITLTRDTPREYLKVKPTKDGFWKVIINSRQNQ